MANDLSQYGFVPDKSKDDLSKYGFVPDKPKISMSKPIQPQQQAPQPAQQSFGALRSIGAGLQQDVANLQRSGVGKALLPLAGGFMPTASPMVRKALTTPIPEPDLSKVSHPGLAKVTEAVAPMAIPFGGEEKLAMKGGELAERFLPKVADETANFLGRMAGKGVHGAAYMNSLNEMFGAKDHGHNMLSSTLWGALSSVIPSAIAEKGFKALGKVFPRLVLSGAKKIYKETGEVPNEEQISSLADGISRQTVASAKALQKAPILHSIYHNVLPIFPLTGIMKEHKKLTGNLEGDALDKFNGWLKGAPDKDYKVREGLGNKIAANGIRLKAQGSKLYEDVMDKAESKNIQLQPTQLAAFKKEALRKTGDLTEAQKSAFNDVLGKDTIKIKGQEFPITQLSPQTIKKYALDGTLKPTVSLRELNNLRHDWGSLGASQTDEKQKSIWKGLVGSLDKDITSSLKKQGAPELDDDYKKAISFYKENVVPYYHEKPISKIMFNKVNLNSNKLETTLSDTLHKKALNDLDTNDKSRLARLLIKPAVPDDGEDAAGRIVNAYKKLSTHEKDNIVTPEIKKDVSELNTRRVKLDPAYKAMKRTFMKGIWDMHKIGWTARLMGLGALGYTHHLVNPITIGALASAPIMAKAMRKGVMRHLGEELPEQATKAIRTEKQLADRRKLAKTTTKGLMAYHLGGQQ